MIDSISYSQIRLFDKCQYAFKLRYFDNCQPMHFDPTVFSVGNIVHTVIRKYYSIKPALEQTKQFLTLELLKEWDYSLDEEKYDNCVVCLDHFGDFEIIRRQKNDTFPVSEVKLVREGLLGIIDALFDKGIIEFKTNKKARMTADYQNQGNMYSALSNVSNVYFYFLYPNVIKKCTIEPAILDSIKEKRDRICAAIKTRTFEPNFQNCKRCEYRFYCEYYHA